MDTELISVNRLAQALDCSPKTVRDWMYKNRKSPATDPLPYYRVGGLVRFRVEDVMSWIDRRRVRIAPLDHAASSLRERPRQMRSQRQNL